MPICSECKTEQRDSEDGRGWQCGNSQCPAYPKKPWSTPTIRELPMHPYTEEQIRADVRLVEQAELDDDLALALMRLAHALCGSSMLRGLIARTHRENAIVRAIGEKRGSGLAVGEQQDDGATVEPIRPGDLTAAAQLGHAIASRDALARISSHRHEGQAATTCPHGRSSWHLCPHCNGVNNAAEALAGGHPASRYVVGAVTTVRCHRCGSEYSADEYNVLPETESALGIRYRYCSKGCKEYGITAL